MEKTDITKNRKSLRKKFEESEFDFYQKSVRGFSAIAAIFLILGVVIDLLVYRDMAEDFFLYRVLATSLMILFWSAVRWIKSSWVLNGLSYLCVFVPVAVIELLIYGARHDPGTSYYGGVCVVLMGMALLIPWKPRHSFVCSLLCVGSFFCVMYALDFTYRGGVIPSYFVFFAAVIAFWATCIYDASRFREFCLRRELQDRNHELRATNETKARFFANISHELRTPLTLILGPLENLRVSEKYKKDRLLVEHLDMIEDNSMRLLRLINDILDLVKLDSKETPPYLELIDVEEFLGKLTSNLKPITKLKGLELSYCCKLGDQKQVWLDRDRLEKIVLNLAINSLKFTPAGGKVQLNANTYDGKLELGVKDTGIGMDEDAMTNVFVRFWQVDMSAKRKHQGTGIGLALVKSLTESLGGEISLTSKVNQGTTFKVVIPAPKPSSSEVHKVVDSTHDILQEMNDRSRFSGLVLFDENLAPRRGESKKESDLDERKKILVVEDECIMRDFIAGQLSVYHVIEAADGEEALKLAKSEKPDCVILDYMIPLHDGVEVASLLRSEPDTARIPIVLLTAQAGESVRLAALEAGVNDFLTKPFSSVELVARVRNLLFSSDFETKLAENNVQLEAAYAQLKDQRAQLIQTEKLSSLGKMSAGIVHEINNPLNYTQAALHVLKSYDRQVPDDEKEGFLEVLNDAKEGVDRVVGIVKGLRSVTRGDIVEMSEINLKDVLENAQKLSREAIAGIDYKENISEELKVNGNEIQLCQLFINMFQNSSRAIKVKGKDQGEISVTAEELDGNLAVKIRDNGCGISKEDIEKIYDPFFTKNDVGEGLGLGLSISYRIIQQHEAKIEVRSELGEFTEFCLLFPQMK